MGSNRPLDLANQRFGYLLVGSAAARNKRGLRWNCACDCGKACVVPTEDLRSGHTRSCGCLFLKVAVETGRARRFRPLEWKPIFNIWKGMMRRCYQQKDPAYKWYGGRGIRVCKRRRGNLLITYKGETMVSADWARRYGIAQSTFRLYFILYGIDKAISFCSGEIRSPNGRLRIPPQSSQEHV